MDYDLSEYLLLAFLLLVFPFVSVFLAYLLTRQVLSRALGLLAGKVPVYLAGRYLFSRQNRGAINIITFIFGSVFLIRQRAKSPSSSPSI